VSSSSINGCIFQLIVVVIGVSKSSKDEFDEFDHFVWV
jgi:hypothetical protein